MSKSEARPRSTGGWRGLPIIEHLNVAAKFTLLLVVLLIPFAASLGTQIYANWQHGVATAHHELSGEAMEVKVQKLIIDLEADRVESASYSAGNKDALDNLKEAGSTILVGTQEDKDNGTQAHPADLDDIDANRQDLQDIGLWDQWQTVRKAVQDLLANTAGFNSDQSASQHAQVIDQVSDFDLAIANRSDMTLDPSIDTHFAMDIFMVRIPEMEHDMGMACALMARVAGENRKLTNAEKSDLTRLAAIVDYQSDQMNLDYQKIVQTVATDDPLKLRTGLGPFMVDARKNIASFTKIANNVVLGTAKADEAWQEAFSDGIGNLSSLADTFLPYVRKMLQARADHLQKDIEYSALLAILGLVFTALIGFYIVLDINRPLRATLQVANSIARGELGFIIPEVRRGDEFGMLNVSLRAMVDNLRDILNNIGATVLTLTSATSEIMTTTSQLAVSSTQMATAVNEATTTVEEVKQTAQISSQRAQQVAQSAQQAAQVSQAGRQATDETLEEMNRIKEQMSSIAESIVRLNEQTQAISEIITSVNDLAEQSNLLAVNASIEAAKAGEQGRGFAVVAQEVRHLAEQSKESTAQVRTILSEIQKATGGAVMVAEQGTKAVDLGVRQSKEAGDSIKTLATRVVEAAQAAVQISASTHQQLVGMDQVVTAMVGIKDGSVQTAASMRNVQTSAQRLYEMTQNLKKLTERYSSN